MAQFEKLGQLNFSGENLKYHAELFFRNENPEGVTKTEEKRMKGTLRLSLFVAIVSLCRSVWADGMWVSITGRA